MKLTDNEIQKVALALPNERLSPEEWEAKVNLPRFQYLDDLKARALSGGPLSFFEARWVAREALTWESWAVTFYEMVQFPQVRYFKTRKEALEYFTSATEKGRTPRGAKLAAQRMEILKPKVEMFDKRQTMAEWKIKGYKPDAMTFVYG